MQRHTRRNHYPSFSPLSLDQPVWLKIFETINSHLGDGGLRLKEGTIVDATIIAAQTSTKNASGERDPEMHQTKRE